MYLIVLMGKTGIGLYVAPKDARKGLEKVCSMIKF